MLSRPEAMNKLWCLPWSKALEPSRKTAVSEEVCASLCLQFCLRSILTSVQNARDWQPNQLKISVQELQQRRRELCVLTSYQIIKPIVYLVFEGHGKAATAGRYAEFLPHGSR